MQIVHLILKIVLALICALPVIGATGALGEPTRDLYNTDAAFAFIEFTMASAVYISYSLALICSLVIALMLVGRSALAMLLLTPITFNVAAFHLFLDGGLFTAGAVMADIMLLINVYFLWHYRHRYLSLWIPDSHVAAI